MAQILGIIGGILKFWDQVTWLIKILQDTPEEKHQALITAMNKEAESLKKTGRPVWD